MLSFIIVLFFEILMVWEISYWFLFVLWDVKFNPNNKFIPKWHKTIPPERDNVVSPKILQILIPKPIDTKIEGRDKDDNRNQLQKSAPKSMLYTKFLQHLFEDNNCTKPDKKEDNKSNYVVLLFPHDFIQMFVTIIWRLATKCKQNHK